MRRTTTEYLRVSFRGVTTEMEVEVTFDRESATRGYRESSGAAIEPDTDARVFIVSVETESAVDILDDLPKSIVKAMEVSILRDEREGVFA